MALNDTDLERISAALSGTFGAFPISNLVNYGSTILIRPGARTTHGVVFSGAEVAAMLPDDFTAFPLAVEYAADSAPELGAIDADTLITYPSYINTLDNVLPECDATVPPSADLSAALSKDAAAKAFAK